MIRVLPTVSSLNTNEFFSTKETKKATKAGVISSGSCCYGCTVDLPAFANPTDPTDRLTNDRIDFIIDQPKNTTLKADLIQLNPDGTETVNSIVDNTYGFLYTTGSLKANFWGFILDWYSVYNKLGYGRYKFNITVTDSGGNDVYDQTSSCYTLLTYSCDNAHRTIKINTRQSGYFEGGIDYTGINYVLELGRYTDWGQEVRLWGRFHRNGTNLITDNIVTQTRGQEQVQSQTVKTFVLKLDNIVPSVSNRIIYDMLQAPDVKINDFNYNNPSVNQNQRVSLTNFAETINIPLVKQEFFTIEFEEYFQNNVHRYK